MWHRIDDPVNPAPKDGTVILVYRRDQGVFTAHFVAANEIIGVDGDEPQWWSTDGQDLIGDLMPTHWYALPAPPVLDGEGSETSSTK